MKEYRLKIYDKVERILVGLFMISVSFAMAFTLVNDKSTPLMLLVFLPIAFAFLYLGIRMIRQFWGWRLIVEDNSVKFFSALENWEMHIAEIRGYTFVMFDLSTKGITLISKTGVKRKIPMLFDDMVSFLKWLEENFEGLS
jgi:hypothetical protein